MDRVMLAFRVRRSEVESWPFPELVHLVAVDQRECIGPERLECMIAAAAALLGRCQGAEVDMFDVLAMNPWSRAERPMPTDAQLAAAVGAVWCEERGCYVG